MQYFILLFWLLWGHAIADYPLQPRYLSDMKRAYKHEGRDGRWLLGLFTHGIIHAGFVYYFTGMFGFALVELFVHVVIDNLKCRGFIRMKTDQALHVLCKISYVALIYYWNAP